MCTGMILEKFLHETRITFIFPRVLQAPRQAPFLLIQELFGMTGILFFHSSQNSHRTNEKLAAKVFVHDSLFCPLQNFLKTFFFMSICGEFQPHFVEGNSTSRVSWRAILTSRVSWRRFSRHDWSLLSLHQKYWHFRPHTYFRQLMESSSFLNV